METFKEGFEDFLIGLGVVAASTAIGYLVYKGVDTIVSSSEEDLFLTDEDTMVVIE